MNSTGHPDVFKNNDELFGHNQEHFKIDPVLKWMKEQQESNDSLHRQLITLETLMKQQKKLQSNQWQTIRGRLNTLMDNGAQYEQFSDQVIQSLAKLETENKWFHKELTNEHVVNREMMAEVQNISESNQEIAHRLEGLASASKELSTQLNEQLIHQEKLSEQLINQEDTQQEVLSRLDTQEGLTEKIVRQMDYFRSILYERTNYIAEKVEESYNLTSSYMARLLANTDLPLVRLMMKEKQEDK